MSADERLLAQLILTDHFGDLVAKKKGVGEILLKYGRSPLSVIVQHARTHEALHREHTNKLAACAPAQLQHALVVLVQHRLVAWELEPSGRAVYEASLERVLHRLWLPQLIDAVDRTQPAPSSRIILHLAVHGRCTPESFLRGEYAAEASAEETARAFATLVETQWVAPVSADSAVTPKTAAAPVAINFERYARHFRARCTAQLVEDTVDESLGQVLLCLMDNLPAPSPEGEDPAFGLSAALRWVSAEIPLQNQHAGSASVGAAAGGVSRAELVRQYLHILVERGLLAHDGEQASAASPHAFRMDLGAASRTIRKRVLEDFIRHRLNQPSTRIWRMIHAAEIADDKAISERCFLPIKDARIMCHDLFELGMVELQEVPKGNERSANRTFFLWRSNPDRAVRNMAQSTVAALARIKIRYAMAFERYTEAAAKLTAEDEASADFLVQLQQQCMSLQLLEMRSAKTLAILKYV